MKQFFLPVSAVLAVSVSFCFSAAPAQAGSGSNASGTDQTTLEIVEVVGRRTDYSAASASSATRFDADIIDVPVSVQVVPRSLIEDQGAIQVGEALRNVSGVTPGDTSGNRVEKFLVRGFENDRRIAVDGFLPPTAFGNVGYLDLALVEQVEVLKGPASVLYGQANPGGFINLVSKRPEDRAFLNATLAGGSYDFARAEIDVNQPLTSDNGLTSRFIVAYQNADSFRNLFRKTERVVIAPSFSWQVDDRSSVDLQIEYFDRSGPSDFGLVPLNGKADVLPPEFYEGEAFSRVTSELLQGRLTYQYAGEDWTFRSAWRASTAESDRFSADARGFLSDGETIRRRARLFLQEVDDVTTQNTLSGTFQSGDLDHEFLVGVDLSRSDYDGSDRRASLAPLDAFNPVYGAEPGPLDNPRFTTRSVDFAALYFQDLVSIGEDWKVLVGGRFDQVEQRETRNANVTNDVKDEEFSRRAGIVYKPSSSISFYANYTESFFPPPALFNPDTLAGDAPFEPENGVQFEVGVKGSFLDDRFFATLAAFDLSRENVLTADPDDPDLSVQTGEQRSRGIELDVRGSVLVPNLNIVATYTYLDAEIVEDNRFAVGNRLPNTSRHSGSLWAVYNFDRGGLNGLELGVGGFAQSSRQGDLGNTYTADGFSRIDAYASYRISPRVGLSINIKNLLDEDYIAAALGNTINPGEPLTVLARLSVRY